MNKKFSTLLAGGLLALSTSAFAAESDVAAIKAKLTQATELVSGNTYFIVYDNDGTIDKDKSIFLGLQDNAGTAGEVEAFNKVAVNTYDADLTLDNEKIQWIVNKETIAGNTVYTFKNVKTGVKLTFDKAGAQVKVKANAKESETTSSYLKGTESGGQFESALAQTEEANKFLKVETTGYSLVATGNADKIYFYQQAANGDLSAATLNGLMGNGFMFSFPDADPAPASNPFGSKLTAVQVKAEGWNSESVVGTGTYFVSSLADGALDATGKFVSRAKFEASTFVAVSTLGNYNFYGVTAGDGNGFKITTVKGEDLVANTSLAKGKVAFENAQFTVKEPDPLNDKGIYEMEVSPYVASGENAKEENAVQKENLKVVAFTTAGSTYVTTLTDVNANSTNKLAVSTSNVLAAKDLLKSDAPAVFNIQFTSGKADLKETYSSEYGKYLGIYNNSGYKLLAQGSAFLDLNAPQNQWYVSDVKDGVFTFKNRESETAIKVQLRKTSTENVYDVVSADNSKVNYAYVTEEGTYTRIESTSDVEAVRNAVKALSTGEFQIKLIPATATKGAGYLDLTKEELAQPIQIKFTVANKLLSKNMYVKANTTPEKISLTEDEDYATLWDVVKFAAKEDSIFGKITYAYMKDEKTMETKEVVDKAITTYALKMHDADYYLDYKNGTYDIQATDKVAKAQRYILKENKDGSVYLIAANFAVDNAYDSSIDEDTKALNVTNNAALGEVSIYEAATDGSQMELESIELLSTSLEAEPRHASFQSVNGGFLGMDENNNAIIAATQEEAKTLTFWLDTTDVKELTTNFYISQAMPEGLKAAELRMFLFNPVDSTSYYDEGTASNTKDYSYMLSDKATTKAIFKAATLINKDSINTVIKGEEVGLNKDNGLNRFKFQIKEYDEEEYVIAAGDKYLSSINGKIGFGTLTNALVVTLGEGDATANEAIETEAGVQVISGKGAIMVQGAAGKVITVANILGQTIANQVAASDNVTIAAPAGVVVVAVDGDATKVVVK